MSLMLEVEKVTVKFGGVTAVENVSLSVQAGELVGFIGPNGAGKTTLMRAIIGMVKPQAGRVSLHGEELGNWPVHLRIRKGLALAQQIVQPHQSMSLLDNVALACGSTRTQNALASLWSRERQIERKCALDLLHQVGLKEAAHAAPATLPLGHLKRFEVARALALKPKLLLLDEPLAGLNQSEARAMADLIEGLNQAGQTILLIEHNLREVLRICPLLYVQDNGRSLAFGDSAKVMAHPAVRKAYLGGEGGA